MGKGCGLFIRLDELYQHPDLPCVEYPRRLARGPGIPRFNWHGVEIVPTDIYQPPNNPIPPALPALPALPAPQFPPPTSLSPYSPPVNRFPMVSGSHRLDDSSTISSSGSGRHRPRSESQSHVVAPPSKMPRLKGKGRATQQTYVVSDSDDEAIPPSPTPAPRQHVRKKHESPPSYATSVSVTSGRQAGSSRAVVDSQSPPRYLTRLPYEPSERFFGDCMSLEKPLDTPMLAVRNSDIPPLTQEETSFYLESLQQPEGVHHWIFWQLVDRCNCGRYYTKEYLHRVHGLQCIHWRHMIEARSPQPLRPVVQRTLASYHSYISPPPPPPSPYCPSTSTVSTSGSHAMPPSIAPPSFEPPFRDYLLRLLLQQQQHPWNAVRLLQRLQCLP
ncbi:hypothetical protein M422DRAFT_274831 [Sphaerobolus stellatus SS14]|uniref:Unplaced genomic scaffold SPHSTscaffold_418, whole genome shotgun sequence n=1 Tax=Sphaerobolus stellatus (strain SS14) TaxID=990650 RepID=A0A0C9T696_SPHS4|nr:hypothetical protein M422DRAFT_274831 [Sphaerobolus stellatus SS14]